MSESNPGTAAHSAKNAPTAPGLPHHSASDTERNTMVEANTRTALGATARRFADLVTGDRVSYTPQALNRLIDTTVRHAVAGRLREIARTQLAAAEHATDTDAHSRLMVAALLTGVATEELARGEVR